MGLLLVFPSPDALRAICKQGRQGAAPFKGYTTATEGSDWIIKCARKESTRPLWILVWGGLDDLAQALHDAPDIQNKIRVYWIGGPNKKWSTNSYVYIVENFPNLWFIEANASYRGFITNDKQPGKFNKDYYDECIRGAGYLGKDYIKYYDGKVKMGDTPSLLYMMDGDPNNPQKESWGGSFEKFTHSPRVIFNRSTTLKDTVPVYAIIEFRIKGPEMNIPADSTCFTMTTDGQDWDGFYLGNGEYAVRYAPKSTAVLTYKITSDIPGFPEQTGEFVVNNTWPGKIDADDYKLGDYWYTDRKPLPPPAPEPPPWRSKWVHKRCRRGSMYLYCASSTCVFALAVCARMAKISRISEVRSNILIFNSASMLRICFAESSSSKITIPISRSASSSFRIYSLISSSNTVL